MSEFTSEPIRHRDGLKVSLVVSPASGAGAAARVAGSVVARIRPAAGELVQSVASSGEHAIELAHRAVESGVDVLAMLGGDGAAHAGLQACAESATAFAVIPAGTGNDLATALGWPKTSLAAADAFAAALTRGSWGRLDLGRVEGGAWFATVLCAGFDSAVNERANRMRWPRGPKRYDLAILAELAHLRARPLVVETEHERLELDATLVAVGNTACYGGGIPVCPDADAGDGLFDLTVVTAAPRALMVKMLPRLRSGRHVELPEVRTLRARSVRLGGDNDWVAYADGERQAELPLAVTSVPGALRVLVPE
ncbi:sphingosine kinase [Allokutzneria sp. A3M-2-11 16]|uniref:diacylglycerol kinase family protein n=1 Tax=Allokutzneria sp. A3M-2-11 16 TaxID=2962043 RepID=UPI0020B82629|nr:diacylglycerol kinase family protein [Allokutzneria sp. A3M-2-11 16]MCP3803721.1 sphingosine kinase [Allokutzneria sp. A3M-2-11 16]